MFRVAFLFALLTLTGCGVLKKEKYTFVDGDFSEVTFETAAPNWVVDVDISTSEVDCQGFRSAGELFYDAQLRGGGFFGVLQKINPIRHDENLALTQRVPAHTTLQIQATAMTNGAGVYGSCGPVTAKFNTGAGAKFKAYVGLKNGYCFLLVTDLADNSKAGESVQCK